jgi:hypothetical protein
MKKRRDPLYSNKVAQSVIRDKVRTDLHTLKTQAELQAWAGTQTDTFVKQACVLLYAIAYAHSICRQFPEAKHGRLNPDTPDARIMRGMASALEDLATRPTELELHRPSIQSGLLAIERVIPDLELLAVGVGFDECTKRIANEGISANDIHFLLKGSA